MNVFPGKGVLHQLPERLQILFDSNVVEIALASFAPYDQRHSSEGFPVNQHFAAGDRRGIHDLRIAGGDSRDVGWIIDDDALADRQPYVLRTTLSKGGRRGCQNEQSRRLEQEKQSIPALHDYL